MCIDDLLHSQASQSTELSIIIVVVVELGGEYNISFSLYFNKVDRKKTKA